MGKHPEENLAVLAALTGKIGGKAQLSRRGRPTHSANPYLKQFSEELNELSRYSEPAKNILHEKGWFALFDPEA
eukprot:6885519-Pyramimonas_sp.AAC.1